MSKITAEALLQASSTVLAGIMSGRSFTAPPTDKTMDFYKEVAHYAAVELAKLAKVEIEKNVELTTEDYYEQVKPNRK